MNAVYSVKCMYDRYIKINIIIVSYGGHISLRAKLYIIKAMYSVQLQLDMNTLQNLGQDRIVNS